MIVLKLEVVSAYKFHQRMQMKLVLYIETSSVNLSKVLVIKLVKELS